MQMMLNALTVLLLEAIDFDSIHYLKSRGIPEKEALKMLINGFLSEVLEKLKT